MLEWVAIGALGLAVGFAGGYAGIGGAPFLVSAVVLLLGWDQHLAQGTILAVMLGPMSLPGVVVMWDRVKLLVTPIVIGVTTYALFSNLGARMAFALEIRTLEGLFGVLLTGLGVHYLLRGSRPQDSATLNPDGPTIHQGFVPFNTFTITIASAAIGVIGGLFGIGAGVLMVPLFITFFGLHKDDARALSLAILLPPVSVGAVVEYQGHGSIDWALASLLFATYFLTNYSGALMGRKHDTRRFIRVMGGILSMLGVAMLILAMT